MERARRFGREPDVRIAAPDFRSLDGRRPRRPSDGTGSLRICSSAPTGFGVSTTGAQEKSDVGLVVAFDAEYGDLLPKEGQNHIDPFEFFDFFTAFNLLQGDFGGSQLFIEAPMYGWNTYLSGEGSTYPDNNVFAITQFFDFQGSSVVQFGGAGLGVGDYLVWRVGPKFRYRLSANVQCAFLSGATSPFTAATGRTYNFAVGGTAELVSRLDSPTFGELGIRARQYLTTVIDGEDGNEFTGYARLWYKLPTFHHFSLGGAATLVNRRGEYREPRHGARLLVHARALRRRRALISSVIQKVPTNVAPPGTADARSESGSC